MKKIFFARLGVALIAAASLFAATAGAQQAYTANRTSLRAGPHNGYPQVGWINRGAPVFVNGCEHGYRWCDVSANGYRGWVNARHLSYVYQNRPVVIYGNGAVYGFPLVGFALGSYWDNHYRGQAWYGNRPYWDGWRPGSAHPRGYAHGHPRADFQPTRPTYATNAVPYQNRAMPPQYLPRAVPHPHPQLQLQSQPYSHRGDVRHQQQPHSRAERSMGSATVGGMPRP